MFLRANYYSSNEVVFINKQDISLVIEESKFCEMSVHLKDGRVIVIRAEPGYIHDALDAKSVFRKLDTQDYYDYGIDMQKLAIDTKDFTEEERIEAIDNIVDDFNFENYPLDDFTANLKGLVKQFKDVVRKKNYV